MLLDPVGVLVEVVAGGGLQLDPRLPEVLRAGMGLTGPGPPGIRWVPARSWWLKLRVIFVSWSASGRVNTAVVRWRSNAFASAPGCRASR